MSSSSLIIDTVSGRGNARSTAAFLPPSRRHVTRAPAARSTANIARRRSEHSDQPARVGWMKQAVRRRRHVEQQLRVPSDRREVELDQLVDRSARARPRRGGRTSPAGSTCPLPPAARPMPSGSPFCSAAVTPGPRRAGKRHDGRDRPSTSSGRRRCRSRCRTSARRDPHRRTSPRPAAASARAPRRAASRRPAACRSALRRSRRRTRPPASGP